MSNEDRRLEARILALVNSFPCLRGKVLGHWDALAFDRWAAGVASSGEAHAARFVLSVWDRHEPWTCGPFNVANAWNMWDDGNWAAYKAWVEDPFVL